MNVVKGGNYSGNYSTGMCCTNHLLVLLTLISFLHVYLLTELSCLNNSYLLFCVVIQFSFNTLNIRLERLVVLQIVISDDYKPSSDASWSISVK